MALLINKDLRPKPRLIEAFNGPLDSRQFARMRDYYDADSLQYLFSVGNEFDVFDPSISIRLIDQLTLSRIKSRFNRRRVISVGLASPLRGYQQVDTGFEADLYTGSTPVCFDDYQRQFSSMFWRSVQENREKTGYIVFNRQNRRVFFEELSVNSSLNEATDGYKAGEYLRGNKVLANVHTHPGEIYYLKQGISDSVIYRTQYPLGSSDGRTALDTKTARYTIGRYNVDFFSPIGRIASRNNIASVYSLSSGSFNIYKHALEVYGGKRKP
ncbi:hypothetical protein [Hymenobacter terrenus]|uniref:hypothetical protein n=1 Tax=Hymenobacter terrenus TaxID=1629124 RepID=UPI000AC3EB93|nr:hypothetical protein [Hymenobacter terrenus]